MNAEQRAKQLYPDQGQEEPFYGPGDYQPIVNSFGEIALQVDDDDYQGDSRILYKRGDDFGLLIFGWGSCSGCDALQACNTFKEIGELIEGLERDIIWKSKADMLVFFKTRDWEGQFSWGEETKQFVEKVIALLEEPTKARA